MAQESLDRNRQEELRELLSSTAGARPRALLRFLDEVHPADLAEWLLGLGELEQQRVIHALDDEARGELFKYAEDHHAAAYSAELSGRELAATLEKMPTDEGVDLLAELEPSQRDAALREIDDERERDLRDLGRHDPDTAGGRMSPDFATVAQGVRVGDAIKAFKKTDEEVVEDPNGVFIIDDHGCPIGFLSGHDLLTHSIHEVVDDVLEAELVTVGVNDDQEDVAHLMRKYGLESVPVVDPGGVLVGVFSAEDMAEVLEDEVEEDVLKLVGTSPVEQTHLPVSTRVRQRMPLMALTVAAGLVTAWILEASMGSGEGGDASLLRYLPIIIGIAGNVGIQSSTILVRAIATGEVSRGRELSVVGGEVSTGAWIGLLCGAATALFSAWMEGTGGVPAWSFGWSVGCAISAAVLWSSFLGCLVPMLCRKLGLDPAIAAGPFLVAINDVSGAAIFMGVAHLLLASA